MAVGPQGSRQDRWCGPRGCRVAGIGVAAIPAGRWPIRGSARSNSAARAEEPHLDRVRVQIQNLRNLFYRKSFHFLQNQHQAVAFVKPFQEILDSLARFKSVADIRPPAAFFLGGDHLPGLLFAQVRLVNQGPYFFLPQQIPALQATNSP